MGLLFGSQLLNVRNFSVSKGRPNIYNRSDCMNNKEIRNDPRGFSDIPEFKKYLLRKQGKLNGINKAELDRESSRLRPQQGIVPTFLSPDSTS